MLKNGIWRIALVIALALVALVGCQEQKAQPGVAVVDARRVLLESEHGKKGMTYLQDKNAAMQAELEVMQQQVKGKEDKEAVQNLQKALGEYRQTMQLEQQRIVSLLQDEFAKVLETYRKDHNLAVILDKESAHAMSPDADITDAVIVALNAAKIDIPTVEAKPEATPEAKPEAAPKS
ncbi:MAG: OmpH family outer membrane protein [Desulfovibrionaceae bacterium]